MSRANTSLETELQNVLQQLINEYDTATNNIYSPSLNPSSQHQLIDILRTVVNEYRYMMMDHRDFIQTTNNTMVEILRTIREVQAHGQVQVPTEVPSQERRQVPVQVQRPTEAPRPNNRPVRSQNNRAQTHEPVHSTNTSTPTRRSTNNSTRRNASDYLFTYLFYPRTNQENVIVRPTQAQINAATEMITYRPTTSIHTQCPITLEEFQIGDNVRRIKSCGHIFREPAINNWFTTNVRCPVCRYDIRDYIEDYESDESDEDDVIPQQVPLTQVPPPQVPLTQVPLTQVPPPQVPLPNLMQQSMQQNITNFIQAFMQNADMSNNIAYYDTSGNLIEMTIEEEFEYDLSVD
jgi:hypothetical protein